MKTKLMIIVLVISSIVLGIAVGMVWEQDRYAKATETEMTAARSIMLLNCAADQHQFFVDNPDVLRGYPLYGSEGWHQMWVDNYTEIIRYMNTNKRR